MKITVALAAVFTCETHAGYIVSSRALSIIVKEIMFCLQALT